MSADPLERVTVLARRYARSHQPPENGPVVVRRQLGPFCLIRWGFNRLPALFFAYLAFGTGTLLVFGTGFVLAASGDAARGQTFMACSVLLAFATFLYLLRAYREGSRLALKMATFAFQKEKPSP